MFLLAAKEVLRGTSVPCAIRTYSTFTDFVRFNKNVSPMKKHMKLARELNG